MAREIFLGSPQVRAPRQGFLSQGYRSQRLPNHAEQTRPPEDFRLEEKGEIHRGTVVIGGKTAQELEQAMEQGGMNISTSAQVMLRSLNLPAREPQELELVILKVRDYIGLDGNPTFRQILKRGEKLGYELVPAETAAHLRIVYTDQPSGERLFMAMNPIADSVGYSSVFGLRRGGDGFWLDDHWARPGDRWPSGCKFVFALRRPGQTLTLPR